MLILIILLLLVLGGGGGYYGHSRWGYRGGAFGVRKMRKVAR
jgi:lipopolysaccharide/colanic/teichoic acid biosynthesis glycosyltransferase